MGRGKFITFEGGEGAGKSTQARLLAGHLRSAGIKVLTTREPGGSPGAEAIRELLVTGDPDRWDAVSEALLNFAARRDHVETIIKPALEKGIWVISDRFADSTTVYQGIAGRAGKDAINHLYRITLGEFGPDVTLVLDIPSDVGLARSKARHSASGSTEDRYENMGKDFHETLRGGFQAVAEANPERCVMIDASGEVADIEAAIKAAVFERLDL
ncbi:MAG: dTMP kinase [Sphingomonadales bacterium]